MIQHHQLRSWGLLTIVCIAQASAAAMHLGFPAIAPIVRTSLHLSDQQLALLLAMGPAGLATTVFFWGRLADIAGEKMVLLAGMAIFVVSMGIGSEATTWWHLMLALFFAAAGSASAHAAGARAVVQAFPRSQHGLVLGIRHTAIPVGGAIGAAMLPRFTDANGTGDAFLALSAGGVVAWLLCLLMPTHRSLLHSSEARKVDDARNSSPLRDAALWSLGLGGAAMVLVQLSLVSYLPLYLHDAQKWSVHAAALGLAIAYALGAVGRIAAGVISDRTGSRLGSLKAIAGVCALLLTVCASSLFSSATAALLLCVATISASWNGVLYATTASLVQVRQSGAAFGMQTTVLAIAGFAAPITFGWLQHQFGWNNAFSLLTVPSLAALMLWRSTKLDDLY